MNKEFRRLRKVTFRRSDGDSLEIGFFEPVTAGWVVGLKGAQNFEGEEGFFIATKIAELTTQCIGRTFDDEVEFWDVVYIFEDEQTATKAGIANEQQSIYQIETGQFKWLS